MLKDNEIVFAILGPAQGIWAGNHCVSVFFSSPFLIEETNADYQTSSPSSVKHWSAKVQEWTLKVHVALI